MHPRGGTQDITLNKLAKRYIYYFAFDYFIPDDKGTSNAKLCQIILTCIVEVSIKDNFGSGSTFPTC